MVLVSYVSLPSQCWAWDPDDSIGLCSNTTAVPVLVSSSYDCQDVRATVRRTRKGAYRLEHGCCDICLSTATVLSVKTKDCPPRIAKFISSLAPHFLTVVRGRRLCIIPATSG